MLVSAHVQCARQGSHRESQWQCLDRAATGQLVPANALAVGSGMMGIARECGSGKCPGRGSWDLMGFAEVRGATVAIPWQWV